MRSLILYLRSRHVPSTLIAMLVGMFALWILARAGGAAAPRLAILIPAYGIASAASCLGSIDAEWERTAAIAWPRRRALHVVATAAVVAGVILVARTVDSLPLPWDLLVRDVVGLSGLAAAGAIFLGRHLAWCPPTIWTMVAVLLPPFESVQHAGAITWLTQQPSSATATITAAVLGLGGTISYAVLGPRH